MADSKPEVDCITETGGAFDAIPTATLTFPPRPIHQSHWRHRPTTPTTIYQHGKHKTGSSLQLRNGKSYRRDSNGYPHIFHHAQYTKVTGDMVRHLLLPYIDIAETKPEVDCISGTGRAIDAIPTATPTFSTTPSTPKSLATSSDISYYHISTWRRQNRK